MISVATGDALQLFLLARNDVRIVLTDVVEVEATRRADQFVEGAKIKQFLQDHLPRVEVLHTTLGQLALPDMRRKLDSGEFISLARHIGELSVVDFVMSLRTFNPGDETLVLIGDNWFTSFSYAVPGNVHLLSTTAFLERLEKMGVIHSAAVMRWKIQSQRAHVRADWFVDKPA